MIAWYKENICFKHNVGLHLAEKFYQFAVLMKPNFRLCNKNKLEEKPCRIKIFMPCVFFLY